MKALFFAVAATLALAGCSDGGSTTGSTTADAGTAPVDTGVATDAGAPVDAGAPAETYPAGPYGSSVGRLFEPFSLTACNREGGDASWRFDQSDFFNNRLTLIMISAMWCVPCQNEAMQIEREVVERYRDMGVRIVQVLVQDPQRRAITPSQCNTWVNRFGLTFPVLMDPQFITQPFVPMAAFPGNVIVDRRGRIRWREYGSDRGLSSIRTAIDEVLAAPEGN
ncbi:MAG: TlpA family protein disulfide reductase [Myxococcales bacterium]|nr:TlpA family protein disulfide reductase [Myxococcales bacterium]